MVSTPRRRKIGGAKYFLVMVYVYSDRDAAVGRPKFDKLFNVQPQHDDGVQPKHEGGVQPSHQGIQPNHDGVNVFHQHDYPHTKHDVFGQPKFDVGHDVECWTDEHDQPLQHDGRPAHVQPSTKQFQRY